MTKRNLKKFDDAKFKKIQALLFSLKVITPTYKLAKNFYRFLKEKDYYVKVGLELHRLEKMAIDKLEQDKRFVEYSAKLLEKLFLEFSKTKKFTKNYITL